MKITVHTAERVSFGFGSNPCMDITVEGPFGRVTVIRQAGIGIWAFKGRQQMTHEWCQAFDAACDAAWAVEESLINEYGSERGAS